jgi:hypothetical protein
MRLVQWGAASRFRALAAGLILASFALAGAAPTAVPAQALQAVAGIPQNLPLETATMETTTGDVALKVQVADTDETRGYGLMYRTAMPEREGMLFLFPSPRFVSFWMKNTPLPLDIIFLDGDGTVIQIVPNTTPLSLDPIPSDAAAGAVLELNAGAAHRLGISTGDRLRHAAFGQPVETGPVERP